MTALHVPWLRRSGKAHSAKFKCNSAQVLFFSQGLAGFYQDEEGSLACKQCSAGTTTLLLGTKSGEGLGCLENP